MSVKAKPSERELSDEKSRGSEKERYLMIDDYILDIMNNFQNYYQSYFSHWSQDTHKRL